MARWNVGYAYGMLRRVATGTSAGPYGGEVLSALQVAVRAE